MAKPFVFLITAACLLFIASPAHAQQVPQKSYSSKFFVGFGFEGTGIVDSTTQESGSGAGLVLGYGFSPRWSLYGEVSGAGINGGDGGFTFTRTRLTHVDMGTRVHFRAGTNTVVPFVQFGLSGRGESRDITFFSETHTVSSSGAGVCFGGGLNAHLNPAFALSAAVTWSVGNVSGNAGRATSTRVHLGIIWFPGAPAQ